MDGDFKVVTPMRPLREVLAEFEAMIDQDENQAGDDPCPRCNGTGTEVVYNEVLKINSGRPCSH